MRVTVDQKGITSAHLSSLFHGAIFLSCEVSVLLPVVILCVRAVLCVLSDSGERFSHHEGNDTANPEICRLCGERPETRRRNQSRGKSCGFQGKSNQMKDILQKVTVVEARFLKRKNMKHTNSFDGLVLNFQGERFLESDGKENCVIFQRESA